MRENSPVPGQESLLPEGASLMSWADSEGQITYYSSAFIDEWSEF